MILQIFVWLSSILCSAQVFSRPVTCQLQRSRVEKSRGLLHTIGGHFPAECVEQNLQIPFPTSAFQTDMKTQVSRFIPLFANFELQNVGVEKAIYETLKSIDSLFDNESLPKRWSQKELEEFQDIVYLQVEENQCIMSKTQSPEDDFSSREAILKPYFQKLRAVLEEKEFSSCAWEAVRRELQSTLHFILQNNSQLLWSSSL
ncbi:interferon alpha-4-like [Denticeps clupeoides]|uniref:interferon alpha-4-like n=1 Tax=Denticeps clupeoides TaxID=299321 RepID=UPI0010A2E4FC|nr:interferon alpha-4-like [Denticeps clupeoides]